VQIITEIKKRRQHWKINRMWSDAATSMRNQHVTVATVTLYTTD